MMDAATVAATERVQEMIFELKSYNRGYTKVDILFNISTLPTVFVDNCWVNPAFYASFYLIDDRILYEARITAADYSTAAGWTGPFTREEYDERCGYRHFFWSLGSPSSQPRFAEQPDLKLLLQEVRTTAGSKAFLPETLIVLAPDILPHDDELYEKTKEALLQVFTIQNFASEAVKDSLAYRKTIVHQRLLKILTTDVPAWNSQSENEKTIVDWMKLDLTGLKIPKANFDNMDFSFSTFERADLTSASFIKALIEETNFSRCNLSKANFTDAIGPRLNFNGADLTSAKFNRAELQKSTFLESNLSKAKFAGADLQEADLSTAKLNGADFKNAIYDESTKFPSDFTGYEQLLWGGWEPDPVKLPARQPLVASYSAEDLTSFTQQVKNEFDAERFKKAVAMLKGMRFDLFSDIDDAHMLGVVKSQTDEELAYACHLRADGVFACCTQNLNPCGGLRGALCKHLLVLAIGLAQKQKVSYTKCLQWILLSRLEDKPRLHRERMSEVFLRYESARSGEHDWRPCETIPEDYYSL